MHQQNQHASKIIFKPQEKKQIHDQSVFRETMPSMDISKMEDDVCESSE